MRVLAIANNFPVPGGIDGIFNFNALRALRDRGHEIRVIRFLPWFPPLRKRWEAYRSVPDAYEIDGIAVRTLRAVIAPKNRGIGTIGWQLREALAREVQAFNPDIAHVHGLLPAGILALELRVPYLLTGHGSDTYFLPFLRKTLPPIAARVVARAAACYGVSDFIAAKLRDLGAPRAGVIYNGADERVFHPRDRRQARRALGLDTHRPCVLFAARMAPEKGLAELQAAAIALADLYPQFVLAGPGERALEVRDALLDAGVEAHATGAVTQDELALLMNACDVLTLPSYKEGLPAVLCEAMNAHRAVVATDVGGIAEIVRDGETGFVVPPHDAPALAKHLRLVLEDEHLRGLFERAAGVFAGRNLTWKVNARAYEAAYEDVLRRRARIPA